MFNLGEKSVFGHAKSVWFRDRISYPAVWGNSAGGGNVMVGGRCLHVLANWVAISRKMS